MQCAGRTGRVGATVVGGEHEDRIVEFTESLQQCDEPADILVGAVEHRGIGFHVADEQLLPIRRNVIQAGTSGSRSERRVAGGTMPSAIWRSNRAARTASQPAS